MKELLPLQKDKPKLAVEKQYEKQHKFIGSVKPHKGQNFYELSLETRKITIAEFDDISMKFENTNKAGIHKKLVVKPLCIYTTALNLKNAERKFLKRLNSMKIK